ncbi:Uncharacterised protein [Neisseria meningitidis]|nr:Uncharacterised protein [Neisseria meningitidis]
MAFRTLRDGIDGINLQSRAALRHAFNRFENCINRAGTGCGSAFFFAFDAEHDVGARLFAGFGTDFLGNEFVAFGIHIAHFVRHQRVQVFIEDFAFFVGEFFEACKCRVQCLFAFQLDAQIRQLGFEGVAAGQFAQAQSVSRPTDRFGRHNLVSFAVFQHPVLMDARFMRKGIGTDNGFVGLHGIARNGGHQFGRRHDLRGIDAGFQAEQVVAHFQRHHDFFNRSIACTFAQAVDSTFHLTCAAF